MAHTCLSLAPPTKNNDFPLEGRRHFMNRPSKHLGNHVAGFFGDVTHCRWQWQVSLEPKRHGTLILPRRDRTRTYTGTGAHLIRSISEIFRAWISHHMLLAYFTNLDFVIHYLLQEIAPLTLTFCSKSPIWMALGWIWYTLHRTNIVAENEHSQEESRFPKNNFQMLCQFQFKESVYTLRIYVCDNIPQCTNSVLLLHFMHLNNSPKFLFANASVGTIPYFCGRGDETPTSCYDLKNPVLQSQKPSHDESKSFNGFCL